MSCCVAMNPNSDNWPNNRMNWDASFVGARYAGVARTVWAHGVL